MASQPAARTAVNTAPPGVPAPATSQGIVTRIRGEFNEMPGLCLTFKQAQRLWALDPGACAAVLENLLAEGFLRRTSAGVYLRADRQKTIAA
jgi:hypothetical protein